MAKAKATKEYVKDKTRTCGIKVTKNDKEQVHCYFNEFNGKPLFNVRSFFFNQELGEYLPSSKGITVPAEQAEDLLLAITKSIQKYERKNE